MLYDCCMMGSQWDMNDICLYNFIHRHAQNSDNGGRPVFVCWQCWRVQDLSSWCLVRFMSRDAEAVRIREGESQQISLRIWYSKRICELNKAQHWSYSSYRKTTVWIHPWVYKTFPKKTGCLFPLDKQYYIYYGSPRIYPWYPLQRIPSCHENVPSNFFGSPFCQDLVDKNAPFGVDLLLPQAQRWKPFHVFPREPKKKVEPLVEKHSVSWISKEKIRIWVGFYMIFAWRNHIFLQRFCFDSTWDLWSQVGGGARKTNKDYTAGALPELVDIIIEEKASLRSMRWETAKNWVSEIFFVGQMLIWTIWTVNMYWIGCM